MRKLLIRSSLDLMQRYNEFDSVPIVPTLFCEPSFRMRNGNFKPFKPEVLIKLGKAPASIINNTRIISATKKGTRGVLEGPKFDIRRSQVMFKKQQGIEKEENEMKILAQLRQCFCIQRLG